jgi:hypothetical protein
MLANHFDQISAASIRKRALCSFDIEKIDAFGLIALCNELANDSLLRTSLFDSKPILELQTVIFLILDLMPLLDLNATL